MKRNLSLAALLLAFACHGCAATAAAQAARRPAAADAVVRELYRVHRNGLGPVFGGKSRRQLDRFFDRELADTIWRELTRPPSDEVGNLDFDPLYNAQDVLLRGFRVGPPAAERGGAAVLVTFSNAGRRERIKFLLRETREGWKVSNLIYTDGSDLLKMLNETR